MADSEASETTQIEANTKTSEKDQPEPMEEAEPKAEVKEEAPNATENGHQTDEAAPIVETKEDPPKDNESAEQTEEATPKDEKEEETPKETENGGQVTIIVETAEHSKDTETVVPSKDTETVEPSKDSETENVEPSKDSETEIVEPSKDSETENVEPSKDSETEKVESSKDMETETVEPSKDTETEKAESSKDTEEKKSEESKEDEKGHGATVAKHYNEHKDNTREERKTSRIFYLRNFNNWVKSVLINEFMEKYKKKPFHHLNVLDLACGKGGDLLKWQKAKISNLICADIAEVSIKQCQQRYKDLRYSRNHRRYNQSQQIYDAQFITADCTKEDISEKFHGRNKDVKFDMTSCQFALHYAFESQEQAEKMLQNACERLRPGGYFVGTIPCANEIINRLRQSEDMSFENECYKIEFTEKDNISLFGHKYNFHLEGVVDCPEFLVHFPLLEKMAEKFGLTLELAQGFHHFFDDHKGKDEYKFLLNRMNSLETYPPRKENDKPVSEKEDAYTQAKEILDAEEGKDDKKSHVGTLSKDEWEAAGLYMVFAFKKAEPEPEPTPLEEDKKEVEKTEEPEQQSGEEGKEDEGKKDDEKMEVDEQDAKTKMDQGDEKTKDADKKDEDVDKKDEETDKKDEEVNKKDEEVDKQDEEVDKKDEDADKKDEDTDKKDEETDKKDEETDKKDEEADKKDEETDQKDEETDQKDEEADKKDEGTDKKDECDQVADATTEVEQGGEAGEQGDDAEKEAEAEGTKEEEKPTSQRGGRRKRSVGAAKEEADTPGEETTPKRGTRKRKSTGGAEEEPPEKKKA